MGKLLADGGFWNNPLAYGLTIAGIILVAVAVILYVMVFHKKVMAWNERRKDKSAEKKEKFEQSSSLASSMFDERYEDERKAAEAAKKEKVDVAELERRINANTAGGDVSLEKPKPAPKKKPTPKPEPEKPKFDPFSSGKVDQHKGGE